MAARLAIAALVLLLAAASVHADDVITVEGLEQLEGLVKKHKFLVVEFYAPWCGHCKKLEPEWAKAATALKGHDPEIVLAKVDATAKENEDAKGKFKISGFPTIKIFKGDFAAPSAYDGPRDEAGIVRYLKKQVAPAYKELKSADEVKAAKADADVLVLAYLEKGADSPQFKTFADVAEALRNDMDFAYVADHTLVEACKSASDCQSPFVVMFKEGETETPRYEGAFETGLLKTWASSKALPLVIKFGSPAGMKHLQKAFAANSPRLIAVASADSAELMEQLQQASKASDDLAVILATAADGKRLIDYYGLQVGEGVELLVEDPKAAAKYLKSGAKPSDVPEFLRQFKEGALERWLKSEEPPAEQSGPVRVLTGKTFDAELFGGGKDVFVEFYAPWCGHCKKLTPIWEEIATEMKDDAGVALAKMDATANDIPNPKITVRGYPTLYFLTAKGDVVQYSGDRSKEDLVKFIAYKRTTKPGEAPKKEEEEKKEAEKKDEKKEEAAKDEL